jgi:predicted thioesterase
LQGPGERRTATERCRRNRVLSPNTLSRQLRRLSRAFGREAALAATPVGHTVRAEAEVTKVDGKRIEFKVSARDELEEIGSGTHRRMVIDLRSFDERLAGKGKR